MVRFYCGVSARAFFTQCFVFVPRQVSTRIWGGERLVWPALLPGVSAAVSMRAWGGRGYGHGKDGKGEGCICKITDWWNSALSARVIIR